MTSCNASILYTVDEDLVLVVTDEVGAVVFVHTYIWPLWMESRRDRVEISRRCRHPEGWASWRGNQAALWDGPELAALRPGDWAE